MMLLAWMSHASRLMSRPLGDLCTTECLMKLTHLHLMGEFWFFSLIATNVYNSFQKHAEHTHVMLISFLIHAYLVYINMVIAMATQPIKKHMSWHVSSIMKPLSIILATKTTNNHPIKVESLKLKCS